jgi:hypothetical protein
MSRHDHIGTIAMADVDPRKEAQMRRIHDKETPTG